MVYFCYIACKEQKGAVSIFNAENIEVAKNVHYSYNTKDTSGLHKYDMWVSTMSVAINMLHKLILTQHINEDTDTVRILIPVKLLYHWLTGAQIELPAYYKEAIHDLKALLSDLSCTTELICTAGSVRNNRATALIDESVEKYTSVCTTANVTDTTKVDTSVKKIRNELSELAEQLRSTANSEATNCDTQYSSVLDMV